MKRGEVNDFKKMAKFLRRIGKEKILERIKAFQNNEHMPNDILSTILSGYSRNLCS